MQQLVDVGVHRVGDLVEVVEHEHDRLLRSASAVVSADDQRVGPRARVGRELGDRLARAGARERLEHGAPEPPPVAVGGSSDSQATGPGARPAAIQLPSSAVLPAPGGAEISVRGRRMPSSSASSSRSRGTIAACSGGSATCGRQAAGSGSSRKQNPSARSLGKRAHRRMARAG